MSNLLSHARAGERLTEPEPSRARRATRLCAAASLLAACLLVACAPPDADPGVHRAPINGGGPDDGFPATVLLVDESFVDGGLCSGSLIAPRVVISAKHCFDERGNQDPDKLDDWQVLTGSVGSYPSGEYGIEEVFTTPQNAINNFDIEVVILDRDVEDADPYELRRDFEGFRLGDSVTLVGFGENPLGNFGRKYSGETSIAAFGPIEEAGIGDNELITDGAAACGGDSGGTVLDTQGRLMGVIVRGATERCGDDQNTTTAITRIDHFLDLIDEGLQRTGICVPNGDEVCDGLDNDCDGETDPGCVGFLEVCSGDDQCLTGTCHEVGGDSVCTQACNVAIPVGGDCPDDTYCRQVACGEAYCALGSPGATRDGDDCSADTECSSLRCRDGVCRAGCQPGLGQCGPDEACLAEGDACDSCLPSGDVPGLHGLGEPCSSNNDCEGGACANVPGDHYCTTACTAECPVGYHCDQGACLRGDPGADGEPCTDNAECESHVCASWPGAQSCSSICDISRACPEGSTCTDTGAGQSACRPDLDILGSECEENDECMGGLCMNFRGDHVCTERCGVDDPCPTDFSCLDAGDGVRVCAPAQGDDSEDGGCRTGGAPGAGTGWSWLLLLALLGYRTRSGGKVWRLRTTPRRVGCGTQKAERKGDDA